VKYYLIDWPLNVRVATNRWQTFSSTVTVKRGETFTLKVTDSVKNYSYEGYIYPSSGTFFNPEGNLSTGEAAKVFIKDGLVNIYVSRTAATGTYTVKFKPLVSGLIGKDSQETAAASPVLPAESNSVTVYVSGTTTDRVQKPDAYAIITSPFASNDGFYPMPGKYEPFSARNILRKFGTSGEYQERIFQGVRYFMRSSQNGTTWGNWYTNTLYSAWDNSTSNDPNYPHPDVSRPVEAYTLDYNRGLARIEERVYQNKRYWMRSSTDGMVTWNKWYTNTIDSAWTGSPRPNPGMPVSGTSFTYQTDGRILEEVQQKVSDNLYKIYQRRFHDNYSDVPINWTEVSAPVDQTADLGL
jgi:hypothetical protein